MSEQCCKKVYPKGLRFPRPQPCQRPATVNEDGLWYCAAHAPSAVKTKQAEREKGWAEESAKRQAKWARDAATARFCEGVPTERLNALPRLSVLLASIPAPLESP